MAIKDLKSKRSKFTDNNMLSAATAGELSRAISANENSRVSPDEIKQIKLTNIKIHPDNIYNKNDTEEALYELAQNIKENGLMHNAVVTRRPGEEGYILLSGERRFKAYNLLYNRAKEAGDREEMKKYSYLPCKIINISVKEENLRRNAEQLYLDTANVFTREGIADELYKRGMDILTAKEKRYGAKTMRELERICLLRNVDSKWMEHIDNMDQLKQGMGLRGYGQHDPVVEYRIEGFAMFDEMIASIREDAVHMLLTIEIRQQNAEPKREQIAKPTGDNAPGDTGAKAPAPVRVTKIGRNDPCPCGSGLKWKKCTCKEYHPDL